jgi:peptide/nickel transport system substrate-binding protein/oligopeptide transport system substrate-binding protein
VTAEDFRESWLRIIDPTDEGEYSFFLDVVEGAIDYRTGVNKDPDSVGIVAIDPYTLELRLTQPASHLLAMLCHMTFAPIHKRYRDSSGWERSAPLITNGPYSLASWSGDTMVLERNPSYWDGWNVAVKTIAIDLSLSPQQATQALNDGSVDWSVVADANTLADQAVVQVAPLFATSYLYFHAGESPWSDTRVRKGLAKLVPWDRIRQQTTSFATDTLVPSLSFYPDVEGLRTQDIQAGLDLLEAAGYPDGDGLPTLTILVIPGSIADDAAREIASVWRENLDLDVEIKGVSFREYQQEVRNGGFAVGSSTWIGDYADPLSFLQMWTAGSKLNDADYADQTYDELINTSMGETGDDRYETLSRAERRLLADQVVVLPLSHTLSVNFIDLKRIEGWHTNALDVHPFKYLRFAKPPVPVWYASAR